MKIYILFYALLISLQAYSQEETETKLFKKIIIKKVDAIDTLDLNIIDTLYEPTAYILSHTQVPEKIALKKGKRFLVFDLLPEPSPDLEIGYGEVSKVEQLQVNGINHKELVVYWQESYGHSGMLGGLSVQGKGVLIYDLKNQILIFEADYFYQHLMWGNELDEDGEIIGRDEYRDCYNYELSISNKQIDLTPQPSEWCSDSTGLSSFQQIWELKKNKFILKKN